MNDPLESDIQFAVEAFSDLNTRKDTTNFQFDREDMVEELRHYVHPKPSYFSTPRGKAYLMVLLFWHSRNLRHSYDYFMENRNDLSMEFIANKDKKLHDCLVLVSIGTRSFAEFIKEIMNAFFGIDFLDASKKDLREGMKFVLSAMKCSYKFEEEHKTFKNNLAVIWNALRDYTISRFGEDDKFVKDLIYLYHVSFAPISQENTFFKSHKYEKKVFVEDLVRDLSLMVGALDRHKDPKPEYVPVVARFASNYRRNLDKIDWPYGSLESIKAIEAIEAYVLNHCHSIKDYEAVKSDLSPQSIIVHIYNHFGSLETDYWSEEYVMHFDEAAQAYYSDFDFAFFQIASSMDTADSIAKGRESKGFKNPQGLMQILIVIDIMLKVVVNEDEEILLQYPGPDYVSVLGRLKDALSSNVDMLGEYMELRDVSDDSDEVYNAVMDMYDAAVMVNKCLNAIITSSGLISTPVFTSERIVLYDSIEASRLESDLDDEDVEISPALDYDYANYDEAALEEVVMNRLMRISNSSYSKHRISNMTVDTMKKAIDTLTLEHYDWLRLLKQAEFLLGHFRDFGDPHNGIGDFDWTFVYVCLAKAYEMLLANFIDHMVIKHSLKKSFELNLKYGKTKKVYIKGNSWRSNISLGVLRAIIDDHISPNLGRKKDLVLFNKRLVTLVRNDRNRYLHNRLISSYYELHRVLIDRVYEAICMVLGEA
jgi:hypothetical protein